MTTPSDVALAFVQIGLGAGIGAFTTHRQQRAAAREAKEARLFTRDGEREARQYEIDKELFLKRQQVIQTVASEFERTHARLLTACEEVAKKQRALIPDISEKLKAEIALYAVEQQAYQDLAVSEGNLRLFDLLACVSGVEAYKTALFRLVAAREVGDGSIQHHLRVSDVERSLNEARIQLYAGLAKGLAQLKL